MKTSRLFLLAIVAPAIAAPLCAQVAPNPDLPKIVILPNDGPGADPQKPKRVIWSTEPGIRYELQESTTMEPEDWMTVAGFPSEAEALAQQHAFEMAGGKRFFRVTELDEQPPEIVSLNPADGAYGIGRFRPVMVELADSTGIDPDSIALSIGGGAAITLSHPALSFEDGVLVYDLQGDTALGGDGETLALSLTVADTQKNSVVYEWSFELEEELVEAPGLFLFGSITAQSAGQRVANIPTRAVAQHHGGVTGPVRMNDEPQWEIDEVGEEFVRISYAGESPPAFAVGQPIANLTPVTVDEIFYRLITGVTNDPGAKLLTLVTEDADFWQILTDGSFSIDDDVLVFDVDEDGRILSGAQVPARGGTVELPAIVFDWSGTKVMGTYTDSGNQSQIVWGLGLGNPPGGENWDSTLTLNNARISATPVLTLEVKMKPLQFRAETALRMNPQVEATFDFLNDTGSVKLESKQQLWSVRKVIWIPKTPLWVDVNPKVDVKAKFDAGLVGKVRSGARSTFTISQGIDYSANRSPQLIYGPELRNPSINFDWPPAVQVGGTIGASVSLIPELNLLLNSLAGIYVNVDPTVGARGTAILAGNEAGTANVTIYSRANLNSGVKVGKKTGGWLPAMEPFKIFEIERSWLFPPPGTNESLAFLVHPQDVTVSVGAAFALETVVNRSSGVTYEWYRNGVSQGVFSGNRFTRANANASDSGNHQVIARSDGMSLTSSVAKVSVVPLGGGGNVPSMVIVQGGTLAMSMGTQTVGTFQIGRHEVTWGEWKAVRAEAVVRGYDIGNVGAGCGDNHPVHSINWFDAVKWCNLKSEIEGLAPVYYLMGFVFKSGELYYGGSMNIQKDYAANGYRLPTEAEWEFAARGGNQTNGFTYSGGNNLDAVGWYWDNAIGAACNLSDGRGTWPVGQKNANELGLYDMSGNVWEWCWDPVDWSYYTHRSRGGSWFNEFSWSALNGRAGFAPEQRSSIFGLRIARSASP